MSAKQDYCLFPRKLQSGKEIYYYSFYDESNRRRYRSTGCASYKAAAQYCNKLLREDRLGNESTPTLKDFTKEMFLRDKCPITRQKTIRGYKVAAATLLQKRIILVRHIWPCFGDIRMNQVKEYDLEEWLMDQKEHGYSSSYVNAFIKTLRQIFSFAKKRRVIHNNPVEEIQVYKLITKEKGILTDQEVNRLFNSNETNAHWKNAPRIRTLLLLAAATGMRLGEIQALHHEQIHENGIFIDRSWSAIEGLKTTKTGKSRFMPVAKKLLAQLKTVSENDIGLVFHNDKNRHKPLYKKRIYRVFYEGLKLIGINKSERTERNITFHSWRHFANTYLKNAGINKDVIMNAIGHETKAMHEHYYHSLPHDNKEITTLQESIIGGKYAI